MLQSICALQGRLTHGLSVIPVTFSSLNNLLNAAIFKPLLTTQNCLVVFPHTLLIHVSFNQHAIFNAETITFRVISYQNKI